MANYFEDQIKNMKLAPVQTANSTPASTLKIQKPMVFEVGENLTPEQKKVAEATVRKPADTPKGNFFQREIQRLKQAVFPASNMGPAQTKIPPLTETKAQRLNRLQAEEREAKAEAAKSVKGRFIKEVGNISGITPTGNRLAAIIAPYVINENESHQIVENLVGGVTTKQKNIFAEGAEIALDLPLISLGLSKSLSQGITKQLPKVVGDDIARIAEKNLMEFVPETLKKFLEKDISEFTPQVVTKIENEFVDELIRSGVPSKEARQMASQGGFINFFTEKFNPKAAELGRKVNELDAQWVRKPSAANKKALDQAKKAYRAETQGGFIKNPLAKDVPEIPVPPVKKVVDTPKIQLSGAPKIEQVRLTQLPEFGTTDKIAKIRSNTRGVITDKQAFKTAKTLGYNEDRVLKIETGTILTKEEKTAVSGVVENAVNNLRAMEKTLAQVNPTDPVRPELLKDYAQQKVRLMRMLAVERGIAAESGRALQAHRMAFEAITDQEQWFAKYLSDPDVPQFKKDFVTGEIAKFADDPDKLKDLLMTLHEASWKEMFVEMATAIKLTAIPTHVVNSVTSFLRVNMNILQRPIAALFDTSIGRLYGGSRERFVADVQNEMMGQWQGWKQSGPEMLRAAMDENYLKKTRAFLDAQPKGPAIKGRVGKDQVVDRILNWVGPKVRLPFRMLGVEDVAMRKPAELGMFYTMAGRDALKKGFKYGSKEYTDHIAKFVAEPDINTLKTVAEAGDMSLFQEELSPVFKKIDAIRHDYPLSKLVVAFMKTPVNLIRQATEFSPLAPLLPSVRTAMTQRGPAADALAKMTIGTAAIVPLTLHALEGNIMLAAPKGQADRDKFYAEGKQPYSIKIGDKWYPFSRLSPFAEWFTLAGVAAEAINNKDDKKLDQIAADAFFTLSKNVLDKSFVTGLANAMDALTDPDKGETFLQGLLTGSLVPTMVGTAARSVDPVIREIDGIKDAFYAKIPYLSKELPAQTDVFGNDLLRPGNAVERFISPVVPSPVKVDIVRKEMDFVGYEIGFPSKTAFGSDLSDEQYRMLKKTSGQIIYNVLHDVVTSPEYQKMSSRQKEQIMKKTVDKVREKTRMAIAQEFYMLEKIRDKLKQKGLSEDQSREASLEIYEQMKAGGAVPQ